MTAKAYRTLSASIRADIAERFGDGQAFTTFDFYSLAEKHGKPHKSVTHILRDMHGKGLLTMTCEQTNRHGGGKTKRYTIVSGAQLQLKTPRDYQIETAQAARAMNSAALRLHAALDNITRARMTA